VLLQKNIILEKVGIYSGLFLLASIEPSEKAESFQYIW
jgi:hypothetical protein